MDSTDAAAAHAPVPEHLNVTLAALTAACMAYALQQTMVVPALPALQRDLHTSTTWVTWLLTGFLLISAIATPLLGKLGDQHGKERLLVISLLIFLVGCVGAVFAWNIWSLIFWRAVQGAGGAVFPLSFAIIKDEFPAERISAAVGTVSSVFAAGGGLGLVLSGVIVDNASWRVLFAVGAAGVAIAAVLVWRFVPESPITTPSRLDVPGAVLLSGCLTALLLALSEGESWGWTSARVVGLLLGSALLLAVWIVVELRVADPLMDMRMLAHRPVLLTNTVALIAGFAMFGSFVLIPNFVETPRGLPAALTGVVHYGFDASSTKAGLYLLPGAVSGFVTGPFGGVLAQRFGAKWPLSFGMLSAAVGIAMLALWHDASWQIAVGMTVLGAGLPMSFAAMAKIVVEAVRATETGVAAGMNTVLRTVGGVIGGQLGAAILSADTITGTAIPAESAYVTAFWMSAIAAAVATVVALAISARPASMHAAQPA